MGTAQRSGLMTALRQQTVEARSEVDVAHIQGAVVRALPVPAYRISAPTFYQRRGKRLLDITLGTTFFIALLPFMAAIALVVLLVSGWPILYGAERIGRNGNQFRMWKLRTMKRNSREALKEWQTTHPELAAEYEKNFKLRDDPRVTAVGRFLRKSSLDELPQLWNVIRGEMSLVGPRPVVERELANYREDAGGFLSVRPGITGRWQVDGRNTVTYPDRVRVELAYCRSVTLSGDVAILARTLFTIIRHNGI
jgi:lipopolysaccharide/colanic/teichoic acid biosynthesis glycosyltransferase